MRTSRANTRTHDRHRVIHGVWQHVSRSLRRHIQGSTVADKILDLMADHAPYHRLHTQPFQRAERVIHKLVNYIDQEQYRKADHQTPYGFHIPKSRSKLMATIDVYETDGKPNIYLSFGGQAKVIGSGGFKVVTAGIDYSNLKPCAVAKNKNPHSPQNENRLMREAHMTQSLAAVDPVHSGRYYSKTKNQERVRCYLPLASFGDLSQFIGNSYRISTNQAQEIFKGLCHQLLTMHQQGYAHRDIKTENVFGFNQDGTKSWNLMDFGLAASRPQFTNLSGTRQWQDPSLILKHRSHNPSPSHSLEDQQKADIFSLGLVGFALLTGHQHPMQALIAHSLGVKISDNLLYIDHMTKAYAGAKKEVTARFIFRPGRRELMDHIYDMIHPVAEKRPSLEEVIAKLQ